MNRSNKSKIAVTLLSALAFGANAQAQDFNKNQIVKTNDFQINSTNSVQNPGKLGQVTGIVKEANWGKRALVITVVSLFVLETVHSIIGAATDSEFGSYSIGRAIKNYAKKDKQPGGPGEQEKKNPDQKIDDKKDDKKAEDKNLETILGIFRQAAQINQHEQLFNDLEQVLRNVYEKIKNNKFKYNNPESAACKPMADLFQNPTNYEKISTNSDASRFENAQVVKLTNKQSQTGIVIHCHEHAYEIYACNSHIFFLKHGKSGESGFFINDNGLTPVFKFE